MAVGVGGGIIIFLEKEYFAWEREGWGGLKGSLPLFLSLLPLPLPRSLPSLLPPPSSSSLPEALPLVSGGVSAPSRLLCPALAAPPLCCAAVMEGQSF